MQPSSIVVWRSGEPCKSLQGCGANGDVPGFATIGGLTEFDADIADGLNSLGIDGPVRLGDNVQGHENGATLVGVVSSRTRGRRLRMGAGSPNPLAELLRLATRFPGCGFPVVERPSTARACGWVKRASAASALSIRADSSSGRACWIGRLGAPIRQQPTAMGGTRLRADDADGSPDLASARDTRMMRVR